MTADNRQNRQLFVNTTVAREIFALAQLVQSYSRDEARIGLVIGDGGHGKTFCLREFCSVRSGLFVQLDYSMRGRSVLAEICFAAGCSTEGYSAALCRELVPVLRQREGVLVLDEAAGLDVQTLDLLRQVICTKAGTPLVLAGNANLLRTVNRGDAGFDQFTSRLIRVLDLDRLASDSGGDDGLYSLDDIRRLYDYGRIELTSDAVNLARKIVKTPRSGRLRTLDTVIRSLHTVPAVQKSGYIDAGHILAAFDELDLPVRNRLPIADLKKVQTDFECAVKTA